MKKNIKMVVTDLDNTLLRRDKTVSDYTVSLFKRLREQGILVAFATARPLTMVEDYRAMIQPDAMALTNAAMIIANSEIVKEHSVPSETANALLREVVDSGKMAKVSARSRDSYYTTNPNTALEPQTFFDFSTPITETLMHISFRTNDEAYARSIIAKYKEFEFWHVSGENLYDVNPLGATKANAAKYLSDYFSVPLVNVAAFGDDYNDIEMLRECGVGVAVANSIDEVKAVADYVCGDCDEDGVARWLEKNVL